MKSNPRTPERRCIGCMESFPQKSLLRIALFDSKLQVDTTGKAKGRGVYVCKNHKCIDIAEKKRGLCRSFKQNFRGEDLDNIFQEVRQLIDKEKQD
ncbi:MAG: YlxR family protein [Peptostreptococcaceae bacterium]|nr:YlxR family protein [Peptostreptococcaceae bacterium]MDY5739725.1 YlxR family protein [Anaerovoracaceae bacterium]SFE36008.1 hypothetical protein SAMN02910327_01007 [Peptostreptococcaceae bacterium pGA-8]